MPTWSCGSCGLAVVRSCGRVPCALRPVPCALCPVLCALCPVLCAASRKPRSAHRSIALSGLYIIESSLPPVAPEVIKIEPLHGFFL